jgi:hypothetical protein
MAMSMVRSDFYIHLSWELGFGRLANFGLDMFVSASWICPFTVNEGYLITKNIFEMMKINFWPKINDFKETKPFSLREETSFKNDVMKFIFKYPFHSGML